MIKTDAELRRDVEQELLSDPRLDATQIAINVDQGAVSLFGSVHTYSEKFAAESAAKRVHGVRTIALELQVHLLGDHERTDSDIAIAARAALEWDVIVPNTVTAKVEDRWITLAGPVTWNYQREAAEQAVRHLIGVVGVFNSIEIQPESAAAEVKRDVEAALRRQARSAAHAIQVEAVDGKVTLKGHATSWQSLEQVSKAAWSAPGVTEVLDQVRMSIPNSSAALEKDAQVEARSCLD